MSTQLVARSEYRRVGRVAKTLLLLGALGCSGRSTYQGGGRRGMAPAEGVSSGQAGDSLKKGEVGDPCKAPAECETDHCIFNLEDERSAKCSRICATVDDCPGGVQRWADCGVPVGLSASMCIPYP